MIPQARWLAVLAAVPLWAQAPGEMPVGLVLEEGLTVTRAPRGGVAARPGEILLVGDKLKAGKKDVTLLSCPERRIVRLPPGAEATAGALGIQSARELAVARLVSACFLPPVRRAAVAGPQHLGATTVRTGLEDPPEDSLRARVDALSPEAREALRAALDSIEGDDVVAMISRGAALEKAGLMPEAAVAYWRACEKLPEAAWLRRKALEMEDATKRTQPR